MNEFSKTLREWLFSFLMTFYTTFVLIMLWDWFVSLALHVGTMLRLPDGG